MKKRILPLFLLIIIAAGIAYHQFRQPASILQAGKPITIYGTVEIRDARLACKEQERLVELLVDEGDRVTAGQVLARLDDRRLQAAIDEAKAGIAAQKSQVEKLHDGNRPQEIAQARAEVAAAHAETANALKLRTRIRATAKSGATSPQEHDDAEARYDLAAARLQVARKHLDLVNDGFRREDIEAAEHRLTALEAGLRLLEVRLADLTLTAPADGTILKRILEPGEMAGPERPIVTLSIDHPKWVRASLPEPLLGMVATGMEASVTGDSFPEQPVTGTIGFISPVAEFTPRTVQTEELRTRLVYETRVVVPDPENRLRLGMPVTVTIDRVDRRSESAVPKESTTVSAVADHQ